MPAAQERQKGGGEVFAFPLLVYEPDGELGPPTLAHVAACRLASPSARPAQEPASTSVTFWELPLPAQSWHRRNRRTQLVVITTRAKIVKCQVETDSARLSNFSARRMNRRGSSQSVQYILKLQLGHGPRRDLRTGADPSPADAASNHNVSNRLKTPPAPPR